MTSEEGALLEPLAVAVHACRRANVKAGSSCTVIGAGAVGLLCAVAARLEGCSRVVIADIVEDRVKFALKNGFADAGFVVPAKRGASSEERLEIAKQMASALSEVRYPDGQAVARSDYTFECTGVESCVQASIMVRQDSCSCTPPIVKITHDRLQEQVAKLSWSVWAPQTIFFPSRMPAPEKWTSSQSGDMQTVIQPP